nr:uncharacterized protein LOC109154771 [Ipomoea batatas]
MLVRRRINKPIDVIVLPHVTLMSRHEFLLSGHKRLLSGKVLLHVVLRRELIRVIDGHLSMPISTLNILLREKTLRMDLDFQVRIHWHSRKTAKLCQKDLVSTNTSPMRMGDKLCLDEVQDATVLRGKVRIVHVSYRLTSDVPFCITVEAFKGWSTRLLNQREKNEISPGGFGYGYIDEPQQPLKAIKDKKSAESEVGLQIVESAQKLLGIPNPEIELTQENEEFWNNPEFIAAFDEIDNAIARRQQYRANIAERPSFSLGMTSDEVDSVIRRVQKTAAQSNAQSQEQNAIDAEFNTPTGPSTEKTPNLTQQTPTEDQTQPGEQQENVDEVMTL